MVDIDRAGEIAEEIDFEPVSEDTPEEFEPEYEPVYAGRYSAAERVLSGFTMVLSALLLLGSIAFWWFFTRRLSICPGSLPNKEFYPPLLICCAAVTLAFAISQIMRRQRICPENWLMNICFSGAVTTVIMTLFSTVTLSQPFKWADLLTTICFSISGCALPAALWFVLWAVGLLFIDHIRWENSKDKAAVYAAVRSQSESRF